MGSVTAGDTVMRPLNRTPGMLADTSSWHGAPVQGIAPSPRRTTAASARQLTTKAFRTTSCFVSAASHASFHLVPVKGTPSCRPCWQRPQLLASRDARSTTVCQAHAIAVEAAANVASNGAVAAAATSTASPLMCLAAVLLGYACLIGSCFRSVPQIIKVIKKDSAEGLSVVSNITELLCYTVMVAYNANQGYPFNTYGEVFACWLQDIVLVALICKHTTLSRPGAVAGTLAFAAICGWLFNGGVSLQVLGYMHLSTIFVMAAGARLPQIVLNHKRGSSGMMSLTTCLLNVAGNAIRIFTTLVITHDPIIMAGCLTQGVLNSILLYQTVRTRLGEKGKFNPGAPPPDTIQPVVGPLAA